MTKYLLLILPFFLMAAGCTTPRNTTVMPPETPSAYENDFFSLTLPSSHEFEANMEYGAVHPVGGSGFPSIWMGMTAYEELPSLETIKKNEEEFRKNMCEQTDACGEVTNMEEIELNGRPALRQLIRFEGERIDVSEGSAYEASYFLPIEEPNANNAPTVFRFTVNTDSSQNTEKELELFFEIMSSIWVK